MCVCWLYCREQLLCTVGTVENSGIVLLVLYGTVCVCCGYCRNSVCVQGYCREQCLCAVGTVEKSGGVLWVL